MKRKQEITTVHCDCRISKKEYARKSFLYMGAKVYNELPLDINRTESLKEYGEKLKKHFE